MKKQQERFIQAIKEDKLGEIKQQLIKNAELIHTKTPEGVSSLLLAAYYRKTDIFDFLLSKKKDLDIFEAVVAGQLEKVKIMINQQATLLNEYSSDGFTVLGLACFFNQIDIAAFLLQQGAKVNQVANNSMKVAPIHSATAIGSSAMVQLLLNNGADVNAQQRSGVTPLHSAAHQGKVELVKLLLKNGANPALTMQDGKTALDFAKADGHSLVVELLKK